MQFFMAADKNELIAFIYQFSSFDDISMMSHDNTVISYVCWLIINFKFYFLKVF